jgi:AraC-like DNA-binding protein
MDRVIWDTRSVERRHQFELYREGMCDAFAHLTPVDPAPRQAFTALIETWSAPGHGYTVMSAPTHAVSRTREDLAAVSDGDYYLNFMLRGEQALRQSFGDVRLRAGDMMVVDNGRRFEAVIDAAAGHRHVAVRLRREDHPEAAMHDFARFSRHPLLPLLKQHLAFLASPAGGEADPHRLLVLQTVEALVGAVARSEGDDAPAAARRTRAALLADIDRNLGDPGYSLALAAGRLGLAPRTVQARLAALGESFSSLLRERRLSAAHLALSAGEGGRSVEAIALETGFESLPSFYRAFKRRYRVTPGDARRR